MDSSLLDELIDKIKEKDELNAISRDVVSELLQSYIKRNNIKLDRISGKDKEIIKKEVRAELRRYVGRFHKYRNSKEKYARAEDFLKLVETHISAKERAEAYEEIIKVIQEAKPKVIMDLGCGLNPLVIAQTGIEYYALDINEEDLAIVKRYFEIKGINGKIMNKDIRKIEELQIPKADLCLMLKVLDLVDKKGHKTAEKIIDRIESPKLLISFSTKTLSGRPMNHPQRGWIEWLLERRGWTYKLIKTKNEIFYLAEKLSKN